MPPLCLSARAGGDNAETRELCVYASLPPPWAKPETYQSVQQRYTQKGMDCFDQDYVEKIINSATSFVWLGREGQPSKPSAFGVETAHDAIRLQAILAYKGLTWNAENEGDSTY